MISFLTPCFVDPILLHSITSEISLTISPRRLLQSKETRKKRANIKLFACSEPTNARFITANYLRTSTSLSHIHDGLVRKYILCAPVWLIYANIKWEKEIQCNFHKFSSSADAEHE